jgi:hypothetical protein
VDQKTGSGHLRTDYGVNPAPNGGYLGDFAVLPPEKIPAGAVGRFWLQDPKASALGSAGWATYSYVDSNGSQQVVTFDFSCPFPAWQSNQAASSSTDFNLYAKSGDVASQWHTLNDVPGGGHPLYVAFVWGAAPLPSDA